MNADSSANEYRASEKLLDGQVLHLRPISPSDKAALKSGLKRLSAQSRYFRFFQHKKNITPGELRYFTEIDFVNHVALVASVIEKQAEVPVGLGRYIQVDADKATARTAEIAFTVEDAYHGLGIATLLLKHLSLIAIKNGIQFFQADVLANNYKMLDVFENSGLPMEKNPQGSVTEILMRLF